MRIIEGSEITRILDEKSCIGVMKKTLTALEEGRGVQFLRTPHQLPGGGIFAFMPACLDEGYFGAKVLTVFHGNSGTAYPSHQGFVLLFEGEHGSPLAMLDAAAITAIRTGAVSALATDLLAKKDACRLALLGCGVQAHSHLRAIRHVRALSRVTVWDIDPSRSGGFARSMAAETGLRVETRPGPREALEGADIICTLTLSRTPVLEAAWIEAGAHINAVGACRPADRELPSDLVARARIYGDSRESVLHEAGDFLIPMGEGLFGEDHLLGTIGGLALGRVPGRTGDGDITVFEALGLAAEDIAAASYVYAAGEK
jgi:ornithine cyclodeaminase